MVKSDISKAVVGVPMVVPVEKVEDISVILRAVLVLNDVDIENLVDEGKPYETLSRRLQIMKNNLSDVARQIRLVTGYDY